MKGKKTSKILVPILMASVAGSIVTGNARDVRVFANPGDPLLNTEVTVQGFKKAGTVGELYELPDVIVNTADGYESQMVLVDPRGATLKTYEDENDKDANGQPKVKNITDVFVPAYSGTYTLKYNILKDSKVVTTTDTMKFEVYSSDYEIVMPENSKYVILDTVKTGTKLRIPAPELKKDGELEANPNAHLHVYVTGENNQSTKLTRTVVANDEDYYEFTVPSAGVYEIEYKYEDAGTNQVTKSQRFVAKDNFDYSKIKLSMSYASTRPTTAKIGNKVELPKVNVVDTNSGSSKINSYVDVKVYYRGTSSTATPVEVPVENYTFVPTLAGNYSVTYQARITYYDNEGEHKIETVVSQFEISDVKDTEAPTPKVVNNYKVNDEGKITEVATGYQTEADGSVTATYSAVDADATEEEILDLLGSRAYAIPSTVIIPTGKESVKVAIPAIYGSDKAVTKGTNLVYTRSVKDQHGTVTTVNKGFDGTTTVKDGDIAYYEFKTAGTYTIRYKAADSSEATANSDQINYTVKVVNQADFEADTPKVTIQSFSEYAYTDTNLVFTKPTATDKDDARMDVKTTVVFSAGAVNSAVITLDDEYVNEDGKYELDLDAIITDLVANDENFKNASVTKQGVNKLTIKASAKNDALNEGIVERNIELIGTFDNVAPTLKVTNNFETAILAANPDITALDKFTQRSKILLPDVVFNDTVDSVLSSNVMVTDPNGNKVTVYNGYSDQDTSTGDLTITNGYFSAEYAGVYNIKYTVKDSGGNAVYAIYQIEVQLSETPELYLANISEFENTEKQLGEAILPPKAGIYVNGEYLTPDDSNAEIKVETYWEIAPVQWSEVRDDIVPAGATAEEEAELKETWELENRTQTPEVTKVNGKNVSFTAHVAGVYTIRYFGSYTTNPGTAEENTVSVENARVVRVTVKDLTVPEIEILDNEYKTFPQYVAEYKANNKVYIPGFKVTDAYDVDAVEKSVEVTGYDGKSITATYIKDIREYTEDEITEIVTADTPRGQDEQDDVYNTRLQTAIDAFRAEHTTYGGMYSFIPNGNGTHTVYYCAVDGNGNETKSDACYVYVGDCEDPLIDFGDTETQDKVITPTVKVGSDFELNMSELVKYVSDNKSSVSDNTLKVTAVLRNASGTKLENLNGSDASRYKWNLSESGKYTLTLTVKDAAGKTTTKDFSITAEAEDSKETKVKEVVGIILIVLSLAVLAGVIVYFVVSGRKMRPGSSKGKKAKVSKK